MAASHQKMTETIREIYESMDNAREKLLDLEQELHERWNERVGERPDDDNPKDVSLSA